MHRNSNRRSYTMMAASTVASALLLAGSIALPGYGAPGVSASSPLTAPGAGFADIIEQVQPSVVTIEISKAAGPQLSGFGGNPRAQEFFERFFGPGGGPRGQVPQQPQQVQGVGSGFIVDAEGYIVTNNHVIAGAETVTVSLNDGRQFAADVVGYDEKTDLAVLKIDADDLEFSALGDSDETRVGDWVVAIGNPFGLGGTATVGIVSARGRDIRSGPYDDYMQIDAPINRGNSGGPVFNTSGEVVGVNTAIYSPNGGSVGIGFAIPVNQVSAIVDELRDNGSIDRGWLGVQLQNVNDDLADGLGMDSRRGALVSDVVSASPAEKAGVEVGDVIIEYDGKSVEDARELSRLVGATDSGDRATLAVWRNSKKINLKVKLGDAENSDVVAGTQKQLGDLGLTLAPLNDDTRDRLGVDDAMSGAVVLNVDPGGAAAKQGLRRGDILVQADRKPIESPKDLEKVLGRAKKDGRSSVPVLVKRGDVQQFTTLPVA